MTAACSGWRRDALCRAGIYAEYEADDLRLDFETRLAPRDSLGIKAGTLQASSSERRPIRRRKPL